MDIIVPHPIQHASHPTAHLWPCIPLVSVILASKKNSIIQQQKKNRSPARAPTKHYMIYISKSKDINDLVCFNGISMVQTSRNILTYLDFPGAVTMAAAPENPGVRAPPVVSTSTIEQSYWMCSAFKLPNVNNWGHSKLISDIKKIY